MQKQQAQTIVKETFQNAFDKERFIRFVKELLNHVEPAPFVYRGNLVPDAYEQHISSLERIGKYTDGEHEVDILIVKLKKTVSIERARTMQRNFIAWYLNGSRGDKMKDAALVAFVSPDEQDWRFSLVKMEYKFEEGKNKKMKVKEEFTPAKRWSFLVGINENSHTAQSRLAPIVEDDEHNPTLQQLEDAFNIEKVTKEFFEKYRDLFLRVSETLEGITQKDGKLKKDFTHKSVSIADFTKKLLGQIVFLYFLQKKGWFGVPMNKAWGEGDKKFIRTLFTKARSENMNYFNDFLEPLFYEALAKERDEDFYSRFECKIPFLNGGLFDPISNYDWVNTVIDLPDDLFSNIRKTKQGDIGDGILDIFDRYNFTVKEDEPLEKEVAVDPEMLGKVFENLLEVKDRKSQGTYYTPREIVHYMCEQSLINYLATDLSSRITKEEFEQLVKHGDTANENEAKVMSQGKETDTYYHWLPESIYQNASDIDDRLATIKVCDPAVGSGAFLVGMMNEIIKARNVLSNYLPAPRAEQMLAHKQSRKTYNLKRDCIQNSLYGVDIDPGAVEIAKLRLWLSLVVDEVDFKQIKPLPNLDYKVMQGNSLIEEFEGIKLFDENLLASPVIDARIFEKNNQKIISLQNDLLVFYKKHPEWLKKTNSTKPQEVLDLENELRLLLKRTKLIEPNSSEQRALFTSVAESKQIRDELAHLHKKFFEETNKSKKDQLRKRIEDLEWDLIEATLREERKTSSLEKLEQFKSSKVKPFFLWKLHFADVFQEKNGFDVVIANPPYIDSEAMVKNGQEDIRTAIQKTYKWTKGNWDIYIAFFELGFKELNKKGTLTFITPDKWISKPFGNEFRKETINNISIILRAGRKVFENAKVDSIITFFTKRKSDDIRIVNFESNEFILKRIIVKETLLPPFTLDHLFSDNLSLLSKVNDSKGKLSDFSKCENACATSDAYKLSPLVKNLPDPFDQEKYLRIINTGTIGKYYSKWGTREMTYLKHKYLCPAVDKKEFLTLFTNSYGIKSLQPKIIIKGLNLLDGCLDNNGTIIPGKTTLIITSDNVKILKFILTIINSKLAFFYIKEKYPASSYNQGTSFTKDMLNDLPIPNVNESKKAKLIAISEKIPPIATTVDYQENRNKQAKVRDLEHQIDEMVYELYGLTKEEIRTIERDGS